jgi:ATP-dependent Clp protease adaptor protein ClpS
MSDANQVIEPKPREKPSARAATKPQQLPHYHVVLLDDNEHTYDYVIDMLQSLFAHPPEQAFVLAEQVDRTGRAIVFTTHKERAELKRDQIMGFGCDIRLASSKNSMKAVIQPAQE